MNAGECVSVCVCMYVCVCVDIHWFSYLVGNADENSHCLTPDLLFE
jgi:hypothetical protein